MGDDVIIELIPAHFLYIWIVLCWRSQGYVTWKGTGVWDFIIYKLFSGFNYLFVLLALIVSFDAAVVQSDGFEYLKENCPLLQSELLKTVAGCEEDVSGDGKSRSVWGQLSDGGGDTNDRSVRQPWESGGERSQNLWAQPENGNGRSPPRQEEWPETNRDLYFDDGGKGYVSNREWGRRETRKTPWKHRLRDRILYPPLVLQI